MSAKGLVVLLLFGLLMPTNYLGVVIKAQNISNDSLVKADNEYRSLPDASTNEDGEDEVEISGVKVKAYVAIWIIFIIVASTVILLTILALT